MQRILVVLPNWFGETLFATPLLRALRLQRPDAFIATLGWPQCREMLRHTPHVNAMVDYDEQGRHRGLFGKWALITTLRTHRFDTAFLLRKSLSRSLLLVLAGIPTRIGFANTKSGWLLTRAVPVSQDPVHKSSTYFPLLEAANLSIALGPYDYTVSEAERQDARGLLNGERQVRDRRIVILHPGANWAHKRWAPDRFAALGDRLAAEQQACVVITGGPDDRALAESITARMRQSAVLLAGRTTLRQLGACLEQARLVVSNDTGVLHIAAALGRPVVGLYGPTSPTLTGPLGHPQRTVVLHHPDCCPQIPCYQPDRPSHPGMDSITVEEAYGAAAQMLQP